MMIATLWWGTRDIFHSGLKLEFQIVYKISAGYAYVQLKTYCINEQEDLILHIYLFIHLFIASTQQIWME